MSGKRIKSNKSKKEQDEQAAWTLCSHCGWKVCSILRHNENCPVLVPVVPELIVWSEYHGVIRNNTLLANVIAVDNGL